MADCPPTPSNGRLGLVHLAHRWGRINHYHYEKVEFPFYDSWHSPGLSRCHRHLGGLTEPNFPDEQKTESHNGINTFVPGIGGRPPTYNVPLTGSLATRSTNSESVSHAVARYVLPAIVANNGVPGIPPVMRTVSRCGPSART